MSWKAWSRTSWPRATTPQVSWLWGRLLTWSWLATWEGLVPWLHPSVSVCVCVSVSVCVCMNGSISFPFVLDCYSVCPPSMCFMQAEYLHCQMLNCQTLVTLNNPQNCRKGRKLSTAFFIVRVSIREPSWLGFQSYITAVCKANYDCLTFLP